MNTMDASTKMAQKPVRKKLMIDVTWLMYSYFNLNCSTGKSHPSSTQDIYHLKHINNHLPFSCTFQLLFSTNRNDYVKNGNLFAYEVKADKDMHDRDNFFNKIEDALDV
jgi:VanZ family protein